MFNPLINDHNSSDTFEPIEVVLLEPYIPFNYQDAVSCPESEKWISAINEEYNSNMKMTHGQWFHCQRDEEP